VFCSPLSVYPKLKLSCVIPVASPVQNADTKSMTTVCTDPPLALVERLDSRRSLYRLDCYMSCSRRKGDDRDCPHLALVSVS
jgi:hypothetical protein